MESKNIGSVRVCTYNIRFIFDRWPERRRLLQQTLNPVDADVYGFQEALVGGYFFGQQKEIIDSFKKYYNSFDQKSSFRWVAFDSPGARSYVTWIPLIGFLFTNPLALLFYDCCALFNEYFLCVLLGKYVQMLYHNALTRILAYVSFGTAFIFGTSMIVKQPPNLKHQEATNEFLVDRHISLRVGGWRSAQAVIGSIGNRRIMIVNVHLSSARHEEDIRVEEARMTCDWIDSQGDIDGSIIMGDFNCYPDEPCYNYFTSTRNYRSAYKVVHGREPSKTFHQDHECVTKDIDDEATLDYVMFKGACFGDFESVEKSAKHITSIATDEAPDTLETSTRRRRKVAAPGTDSGDQKLVEASSNKQTGGDGVGDCTCGTVYLIGTKASPADATLYPSDHYGIVANFRIV